MNLIGICGAAGHGKDTTAKYIAEFMAERGHLVCRRGFADKMKYAGMRAFFGDDLSERELLEAANDLKKKGAGVTVNFPTFRGGLTYAIDGRTFWEHFGTEALRGTYGAEFHVEALLPIGTWRENFQDEGYPMADVAVIPDVRFPNEIERIREFGGEVWKVKRPHGGADHLAAGVTEHASKREFPDSEADVLIMNAGTRDDLRAHVNDEMVAYMRRHRVSARDPLGYRLLDR